MAVDVRDDEWMNEDHSSEPPNRAVSASPVAIRSPVASPSPKFRVIAHAQLAGLTKILEMGLIRIRTIGRRPVTSLLIPPQVCGKPLTVAFCAALLKSLPGIGRCPRFPAGVALEVAESLLLACEFTCVNPASLTLLVGRGGRRIYAHFNTLNSKSSD
jgi:hypothetical protein